MKVCDILEKKGCVEEEHRIGVGPSQTIEMSRFMHGKWLVLRLKVLFLHVKR